MIQKQLKETIEITNDLGKLLKIEYYITETLTEDLKVIYGILIRKYILTYSSLKFDEEESVLSLTYSYAEINEVCKVLYTNKVTPMSLVCILDTIYDDIRTKNLMLI